MPSISTVKSTTVVASRTRGLYDEIGAAVVATADTDESVYVEDEGWTERLMVDKVAPAVRRFVSEALRRRVLIGKAFGEDGEELAGWAFTLGPPIDPSKGPVAKKAAAAKAAGKKAAAK